MPEPADGSQSAAVLSIWKLRPFASIPIRSAQIRHNRHGNGIGTAARCHRAARKHSGRRDTGFIRACGYRQGVRADVADLDTAFRTDETIYVEADR